MAAAAAAAVAAVVVVVVVEAMVEVMVEAMVEAVRARETNGSEIWLHTCTHAPPAKGCMGGSTQFAVIFLVTVCMGPGGRHWQRRAHACKEETPAKRAEHQLLSQAIGHRRSLFFFITLRLPYFYLNRMYTGCIEE